MDYKKQLIADAIKELEIPNADGTATLKIRVKRPSLAGMAMNGEIPNHLIPAVIEMLNLGEKLKKGEKIEDKEKAESLEKKKEILDNIAGYSEIACRSVMVDPTFDEVKDYLTDYQINAIVDFANGRLPRVQKTGNK